MLLSFRLVVSKKVNKGIPVYTDSSQLLEEILELQNWWCKRKSTSHIKIRIFDSETNIDRKFIFVRKTLDNWMPKAGDRTSNPKSFVFVHNLEFTSSNVTSQLEWILLLSFCQIKYTHLNTYNFREQTYFKVWCNVLQWFESSYCISTQIFYLFDICSKVEINTYVIRTIWNPNKFVYCNA